MVLGRLVEIKNGKTMMMMMMMMVVVVVVLVVLGCLLYN